MEDREDPNNEAGVVQFGLYFVAGCCSDEAQSQAAFAIRAMTLSRVASSAEESETKMATARCVPFGSVMIPISLVAEVMPFWVPPVPVLCATTVPAGNSPLRRFAPGMASVISFNNKAWLSAESPCFDCKTARSASAPLGVAQFRYCVSQSRPISFS